jgi:hypothetical protein
MRYFAQKLKGMPFFLQRVGFRWGFAYHFERGYRELHPLIFARRILQCSGCFHTRTGVGPLDLTGPGKVIFVDYRLEI